MSPKFVFRARFLKKSSWMFINLWGLSGEETFLCPKFSFFVNKTELDIILLRHVMREQAWLLTKNHAWLGMFFAAMICGERDWKILESWIFCLNQSSWSYSHRITFRKYLLVIDLWWVNIIAAFSISSLNSIWESYMCPAVEQTSGRGACTGEEMTADEKLELRRPHRMAPLLNHARI